MSDEMISENLPELMEDTDLGTQMPVNHMQGKTRKRESTQDKP